MANGDHKKGKDSARVVGRSLLSKIKKQFRSFQLGGDSDLTPRERFRITVADLKRVTERVNKSPGGVNEAALRGVMIRLRRQRMALQNEIVRGVTRTIRSKQKPRHV